MNLQQPNLAKSILALCDDVAQSAAQTERDRAVSGQLIARLKEARAFRALIPQQYAGLGMPFEDYLQVIQQLSKADTSTAWCVNQAAVISLNSLWLGETQIKEIWAQQDTSFANGPPFDCMLQATQKGYELTGHWGFSSGCQHATWMTGATRCSEGGWRMAFFKPGDVEFIDNWQVSGLRGTGSFEFKAHNLPIETEWVANVGRPATHQADITLVPQALLFAVSFAAVCLGLAAAALEDTVEIAQGKLPRYAKLHLHEDPDVHRFIGQATARLASAQAYLRSSVAEVLAAVHAQGEINHAQRAKLRLTGTHVIRECAEVVDLAYKVAGSTAIYQDHSLHRRFQDMHVITQHVQARQGNYALIGRYTLSGEYELGPMT